MEKKETRNEEINPSLERAESIPGETMKLDTTFRDQGAAMFQEIQQYTPEELEAESDKVRRLIDWHIMPIVSLRIYLCC